MNIAPKIALIGKTGVGKTSTINSLFNTKLTISHTEACTQKSEPITLSNGKGKLIVYDMPGLGEDLEKDEYHKETYKNILPECDVILWVLNIEDREMSFQQTLLKEILSYYHSKLVICANRSDIIFPNDWNEKINLPSEEQLENLTKRISDIRNKLCKIVVGLKEDRIVFYSALKRYKLQELFGAMLEACPDNMASVLKERGDLADFKELIDPEILKEYSNARKKR